MKARSSYKECARARANATIDAMRRLVALAWLATGCLFPDLGALQGATGGTTDAAADGPTEAAAPTGYQAVVLSDGPVAYYRLDEMSGNTIASVVAAAPTGHFTKNVTLRAPSPVGGGTDTAATFSTSGGDSDLGLGDDFGFSGTAPFTIEAWVNPASAAQSYRHVFSKADRTSSGDSPINGYNVVVGSGSAQPTVWIERFVAMSSVKTTLVPIAAGAFTHVVATYDGAALRLYVNGTATPPAADARTMPAATTGAFIGSANGGVNGGHGFPGVIDEVAIYDKALSADRVLAHYQAGK